VPFTYPPLPHRSIQYNFIIYTNRSFTRATTQEAITWLGLTLDSLNMHAPTPMPMDNGVYAQALHVICLAPHSEQRCYFVVTCLKVQDFKKTIKHILHCVSDNPEVAYVLQLLEVNLAGGQWHSLLIRFRVETTAHAKFYNVLLNRPDTFTSSARSDTIHIQRHLSMVRIYLYHSTSHRPAQ
jgi:hypothetical protein